ncbi:MAG TPA: amidohydrolase family protein [Candidatus Cybelea sp.]|jgi:imidazolonepropionase-like amidohydrolase|nr:amidohydrolase family protein [Candidatus Cybelea sp.]
MCSCRSHRQGTLFGLPLGGDLHSCLAGELPIRRRDWLSAVGSAAAVVWAAPAFAAAKLYGSVVAYDYVSSGVVKGSQTTLALPDGRLDVRFEFVDRGRGPKMRSLIALDPAGLISSLRTTGYNYLKVPVDERFTARNGTASWKNSAEHETQSSVNPRFYVSMDGSPEEGAILVRAALRATKAKLDLWPSGVTRVTAVTTLRVNNGGATKRVTMYEATGLDFTPADLWLDENGELFMSGGQWGAVIRSGWNAVLPQLIAAQELRVTDLGRQIAQTLPQRAGTAIAITNVSLFDSEAGDVVPNATVLFHGDRVAAVGGAELTLPADARRIDGTGKTLLPGLWNMHMHLFAEFGPRLLAEGVTTIRDPGNNPQYIAKMKAQFESGELLGPRVIIAGLMDGTGKYTAPIGTTTSTAAEAIAQVGDWKKTGAVQIKIYSSMDPKLVPIIAKEAHAQGMRVSGHIPAGMLAQDAVRQGYDEIQHVNFLFLNFMPDTKDRTQTPIRLTATAERAGTIDLRSQAVADFIALLKEKDIVSDPTVGIFYSDTLTRNGDVASTGFAEIADWLPAQVRRTLTTGGLPLGPGLDAKYRASAQAYLDMVMLLHTNGIRIVAGTDDILPGFDLVHELELYAQAGMPTTQVLQAATIVPARVMKMDADLGSLRSGKLADAIVVNGNPVDRIARLRSVETTIKSGVIYDTRALYATAGVTAPPA